MGMRSAYDLGMRRLLLAPCAFVLAAAACEQSSTSSSAPPEGEGTSPIDGDGVSTPSPGEADPTREDASVSQSKPLACVTNRSDGGSPDISVSVDGSRGPHGAAPAKVDPRRLVGMNIADWRPQDYMPKVDPAFGAYLKGLRPGALRWPAGHRSQEYNGERGGGGQSGDWTLTAAHVDAFVALAKSVSAEPVIALNVKRGTPAAAADLVRYLNVEKKYGVHWFLVGNEPDLTDGVIASPEAYAQKYVAFADAVRGVDPSAKLIAPELLTGAHVNGAHGRPDWLTPTLVAAPGKVDGMSWHYYPLDSGQSNPTSSAIMSVPHLFQETAPDWRPASIAYVDEVMPALKAASDAHAPNAGVWITEFAEDPGPGAGAGISDTVAGALWVGDALGRYAEYAPAAIFRWVFRTVAEHGYGLIDKDALPRPAYGAYWLYGREMGDRYVAAVSSSKTDVAVHASLRPDGGLAIMLVNKTESAKRVHLDIEGFCVGTASEITLTGDGYGSTSFTLGGQAVTPSTVETISTSAVGDDRLFDVEVPGTSVHVIVYQPPTS